MEEGRHVFLAMWRNPVGTVVLYSALVIHIALVLTSIYRRRSLRMPAKEAVQIGLGLVDPAALSDPHHRHPRAPPVLRCRRYLRLRHLRPVGGGSLAGGAAVGSAHRRLVPWLHGVSLLVAAEAVLPSGGALSLCRRDHAAARRAGGVLPGRAPSRGARRGSHLVRSAAAIRQLARACGGGLGLRDPRCRLHDAGGDPPHRPSGPLRARVHRPAPTSRHPHLPPGAPGHDRTGPSPFWRQAATPTSPTPRCAAGAGAARPAGCALARASRSCPPPRSRSSGCSNG